MNEETEPYYHPNSQFDKQGDYFYYLVKQAGWERDQVMSLIAKKFKKTHWNLLNKKEKSRAITIMKAYAAKNTLKKEKALRQTIYATWIKSGYTKDELKDYMLAWGFGDSTRACNFIQLVRLLDFVRTAVSGRQ